MSLHAAFLFNSVTIRENLELSDPAAAQVPSLAICYMQTPVEIAQRIATPARHSGSAAWVSSTRLFSLEGSISFPPEWRGLLECLFRLFRMSKSRSADFRTLMYMSVCHYVLGSFDDTKMSVFS